jgi:hypothetical protein
VGDDVTGALNQLEPVTCRITANQLFQDWVSFRFTPSSGFTRLNFSVLVVGTHAHRNATARFLGEASQKRETASDADPA